MIRPDERATKALANVVQHYPEVVEWIAAWRMHELQRLPYAINNPTLFQGRCQVLDELIAVVKQAPVSAAKA
jgi:hypothetical protein